MARVSVEQKALTDPRFDLLGRFLQSSRHDALGRMILVWNECQERSSYTLPERLVGAIMGSRDGAEWLVEADLAEWVDDASVRIRGTAGRIEWLEAKRVAARNNGKKGGRPTNPQGTDVGYTSDTSGLQPETPPAPAPAHRFPSETSSSRAKPARGKKVLKAREADPLFDAIAEVTASDPATTGSLIGRVRSALLASEPPYTPEEVRDFGTRFTQLCTWASKDGRTRPELAELQKHISKIRASANGPPPKPLKLGFVDFPPTEPMKFPPKGGEACPP